MPLPPGRDSTTSVWPVLSVTFLLTMRCSVSELAPGVKGITTVIGRDESSSAAASCIVAPLAANAASKTTDGRNICVSRWGTRKRGKGSPDVISVPATAQAASVDREA